ncbi:MAG: phosphoribosylaminoimidazolesuccinocarboxamide synthase [Methanomicrobiales archaeon]|nr:phosphoribosylaminoimidazolesuccinocarboxamide synthase [Methanomicrobiales archaeon]
MSADELIYSGKAKTLYSTAREGELLMEFRDDITAFDGGKKDILPGKGYCNCCVTAFLFGLLEREGIRTQLIGKIDATHLLVRSLQMIPIEVIVRNRAAGSFVRRYPFREGDTLKPPVCELNLKDDSRHDPMLNEDITVALGLATKLELREMRSIALRVNRVLSAHLERLGIVLADFKCEFGRFRGELLLGDEISMDSMRLWDALDRKSLDKDVYRYAKGDVMEVYRSVARRITSGSCG